MLTSVGMRRPAHPMRDAVKGAAFGLVATAAGIVSPHVSGILAGAQIGTFYACAQEGESDTVASLSTIGAGLAWYGSLGVWCGAPLAVLTAVTALSGLAGYIVGRINGSPQGSRGG